MDTSFKPYKKWMVSVLERYPCGRDPKKEGQGRAPVYYLCRCDCGKEFILTGDEVSRHPYSCGCKVHPDIKGPHSNEWALGYVDRTLLGMIKPTRAVYCSSSSGVSGIWYYAKRRKWRAEITFQQKRHFLGEFKTKEDAITARIEAERKYYDPFLAEHGVPTNDVKCQKIK